MDGANELMLGVPNVPCSRPSHIMRLIPPACQQSLGQWTHVISSPAPCIALIRLRVTATVCDPEPAKPIDPEAADQERAASLAAPPPPSSPAPPGTPPPAADAVDPSALQLLVRGRDEGKTWEGFKCWP